MHKLKAKITGSKVHDVGYRVLLVNKALSMGVDNFNTFNIHIDGTETVIAIIESDDETIQEFKDFITAFKPKDSIVEDISFEEHKGTVPPIERAMQAFQMEQWGKGIPILLRMVDKQDGMLEKQDKMLEKLDDNTEILKENTSILKDFKNETNMNFGDLRRKSLRSKSGFPASNLRSHLFSTFSSAHPHCCGYKALSAAVPRPAPHPYGR